MLVAVVAIFATAWLWRYSAGGDVPDEVMHRSMQESKLAPSPSVVLAINASKASPAPPLARAANESAIAKEFATAKGLKALYDRLAAQGAGATPDAKYYLYRILSGCATRTDQPDGGRLASVTEQRQRLEAQIPAASRDRAKRLALYDQMTTQHCDGMEKVATTQAELDRLLADAAAGNDPKARALLAARDVSGAKAPPGSGAPAAPTLPDATLRVFQEAIASRDPEAIYIAGTALSNTFSDVVPEIGPNHEEMQGRAAVEAWRLVACEYGMDCGSGNRMVQGACVYSGQCTATTVQDQVYFYGVTPYEAQLIDQYRQVFRNAAGNNDWSGIEFARRPNTSGNRWSFGPPIP